MQIGPSKPYLLGNEARRHLKARDLARVERLYRNALATEPAASEAWHLLAIVLAERNCLADAARAAQRAIDLLPSDAAYWVTRGMISSDQDLSSEAQASFHHALKLNPKLFEAHYLLGRSYHRTGRFADAIGAYRKAMRLAPERPEVSFHLARALLVSDRAQEALDAFQRAFAPRTGKVDWIEGNALIASGGFRSNRCPLSGNLSWPASLTDKISTSLATPWGAFMP